MDDGGRFDFLELKLVGGVIRLRLNLGEGATILAVGQNLNDRQWHKVEVSRNEEDTTLKLDKESQTQKSLGQEYAFGNLSQNSFMFVGGMPITYSAKLSLLALPSVMFEPRYRGSVRNLLYSNCGGALERVDMIESRGVRTNKLDLCEEENPCKHEGICISTDSGSICDCSATEYEGPVCEEREYKLCSFFTSFRKKNPEEQSWNSQDLRRVQNCLGAFAFQSVFLGFNLPWFSWSISEDESAMIFVS